MPRTRSRRGRYMRDRMERKMRRNRDMNYDYEMDYRGSRNQHDYRYNTARNRDRYPYEEYYMDNERYNESYRPYDYGMMGDYRRSRMNRDYRDYADDDYDEEYHDDLKAWTKKLKKYDRFGLTKDQVIQKAKDMKVSFDDYDEDEFYAIYLMHVSDYPSIANEPHTYLAMAKSWLEDKDLDIEPSEKVCKYLYEIVMADED